MIQLFCKLRRAGLWLLVCLLVMLFSSNLAVAAQSDSYLFLIKEGSLTGFIDEIGQFVIVPQYTAVWNFSEGLTAVQWEVQGKIGFINKKGETVIPARYSHVRPFKNGRVAVRIDDTRVASSLHSYLDLHGAYRRLLMVATAPETVVFFICLETSITFWHTFKADVAISNSQIFFHRAEIILGKK